MSTNENVEVAQWQLYWNSQMNGGHRHADSEHLDYEAMEHLLHMAGGESVLDVGCGAGELTTRYSRFFNHTVGCDPSLSMLQEGIKRDSAESVEWIQADDESIWSRIGSHRFDRIVCASVVQYFPPCRLAKFLVGAKAALHHNGRIILFDIIDPRLYGLFVSGALDDAPPSFFRRCFRSWHHSWISFKRSTSGLPPSKLGRSYSPAQIAACADESGLICRLPRSAWYQYRFHAILTSKDA